MNLKSKIAVSIAFLAFMAPAGLHAQMADFHVVPMPQKVVATQGGAFQLSPKTLICYPSNNKALKREAEFLADYIHETTGLTLGITNMPAQRNCIRLTASLKHSNPEAYMLRANSDIILIDGASSAGVFYGVQTLRKSLPTGACGERGITVPATEVTDAPRFSYRGAHLDVSRHFVGVDSVRRFIDMLALHNINRFHWHLTDDQGWRIEIKKYPKLTTIGSQRDETVIGHNTGRYDGIPYGGFYTQKQIKEIVKYAAERHITIVPEIDMPGHMQAALTAYPELGCTGGPYKVWTMWGVSDNVLCAGNDKTLKFIDDVLDEVVKLFPSQYIHVGGDECPKTVWKTCPKCQARIKANGLEADGKHSAEERLQSYVIRHAEEHLTKLGRSMIGWDEILEGGLAPNASVMSWRGEAGGIEAAKQNHDVVMTPNTYLYFDYYQSADTKNEPEAIGGYLPIERVYSYEPMPKSLTAAQQKHIIGVQANCWTEYMPTYRQIEYMELPRMAALSEVQWSKPENKDYDKFLERLPRLIDIYNVKGYNYARTIYNVHMTLSQDTTRHAIMAELTTFDNAPVHYTLDGSEPTTASPRYTAPIAIDKTCKLRAASFRGNTKTPEVGESFRFNKATACPIRLLEPSNPSYTYAGAQLLVDGLEGETKNYRTGRWIGFAGHDLDAVIDLGKPTAFSTVNFNVCIETGDWIFGPRKIEVLTSDNGTDFTTVYSKDEASVEKGFPGMVLGKCAMFDSVTARYVRLRVASEHAMPEWHGGHGNPGFLFVDEISVK